MAVPSESINFPVEEEKILEFWKRIDAFKNSLQQSSAGRRPRYTFYDGPPFATGLPHYGHILAGTIKDIVTRYAHQTGHHVERRFGWDCHGLPVVSLCIRDQSDYYRLLHFSRFITKTDQLEAVLTDLTNLIPFTYLQ
jgi:isoleucyl-tRNA synthetase